LFLSEVGGTPYRGLSKQETYNIGIALKLMPNKYIKTLAMSYTTPRSKSIV